jgi:hypothetical protein
MAVPGICVHCGVTEAEVDGDRLMWHDETKTCCSKYACVKKQREIKKQPARSNRKYGDRYRGWGLGAIAMDLRRRQRRRRKRAA